MKRTTRRSFLASTKKIALCSFLAAQSAVARRASSCAEAHPADISGIRFHELSAEPLVSSSYPTHSGFDTALRSQLVVITASGLERVDWDLRTEKNCWLVRLPEMAFVDGARWDYQVGMDWQNKPGGWEYENCPIRNLKARWIDVDGKMQLAPGTEQEVPALGRMAATVRADAIGVHYTLTLTNHSEKLWKNVFFWICLGHYQSPITGYRPYFRVGESWRPGQEMPSGSQPCHTYYPAPGMVEAYRSSPDKRFHAADTQLSFPGVVCWNRTLKGPLLVGHCSKDAMALGSNQSWPCTDLQLWFGNLAPGEEKSRTGHVFVARCDLKTFAQHADTILERLD